MIVPLRFFFSTLFERCQFFLMGPICGWSPPPHFQLWLCWNSLTPMLLAHSHSICLWIDIRFTISYFTTVIDPFDGLFRFLRLLRVVSFHLSKHFQVNFFFSPLFQSTFHHFVDDLWALAHVHVDFDSVSIRFSSFIGEIPHPRLLSRFRGFMSVWYSPKWIANPIYWFNMNYETILIDGIIGLSTEFQL